ncbi:MAG: protein kinase [Gemmatimonadales bacterium]
MTPSIVERLSAALGDRYRIERELGQGGMATVYLAHDLKHGRDVALKVLKPELAVALGGERFLAEIRVMATLQHPHLLPLFDSGEADGLLFYVMPYLEGETLRNRLDAERQLSVEETIRLVGVLAGALDFAHARGVIHRDLKPENILLQAGQPVIADFGIALAVAQAGGDRITETGLSLGTPSYMSPEQASGTDVVDTRSDQFALAAVAYEMLVGEPPHTGASTQAIIARVMTERPRSIRAVRPAVPPGVESAVQRALAKPPADRFARCGAFAEALAAGIREPVRAGQGRRLAAVGAVVALIAAIGFAVQSSRSPDKGPAATSGERSLAVLPFTSVGGDTANAYFAAGIAAELSSALTRIPGLRLAGHASAARVKERGDATIDIGTTLNVEAVLDGSVRRAGNRIRVTAELTSSTDGRVIWNETYERALEDVFSAQDEITRAIVSALQVRLASGVGEPGQARGGTTNLAAYDLYLRGLQGYRARNEGGLDAERYLREAIARDPGYAAAHALLASVLLVKPFYVAVRGDEVLGPARAAAMRAVALDDSLASGHVALGFAHMRAGEWDESEREFRRALALDPQVEDGYFRLGDLLLQTGRVREALEQLDEGTRRDPLYTVQLSYRGWALALLGRSEEARATMRQALALDPRSVQANAVNFRVLVLIGTPAEVAEQARTTLSLNDIPMRRGRAAWAFARGGNREEAATIRHELEALPAGTPGRETGLTFARLGMEDWSGGLNALEDAAAREPQRILALTMLDRAYDPIRSHPRFAAVIRKLNLDVSRFTLPDGGRSLEQAQ